MPVCTPGWVGGLAWYQGGKGVPSGHTLGVGGPIGWVPSGKGVPSGNMKGVWGSPLGDKNHLVPTFINNHLVPFLPFRCPSERHFLSVKIWGWGGPLWVTNTTWYPLLSTKIGGGGVLFGWDKYAQGVPSGHDFGVVGCLGAFWKKGRLLAYVPPLGTLTPRGN